MGRKQTLGKARQWVESGHRKRKRVGRKTLVLRKSGFKIYLSKEKDVIGAVSYSMGANAVRLWPSGLSNATIGCRGS
jgi:hypothetical protein